MGADALRLGCCGERGGVRVFDDFQLVLLVRIKEAVEACWGEMEGFGD